MMGSVALWVEMTRLPSDENFSSVRLTTGSRIGVPRLATQTVVKTGIILYHTPRYQPGEAVVVYLLVMADPGWKNPSANLPFLEMSLPPTASAWPTARVSSFGVAAEHETGACREENIRRSQKSNALRVGMVKRMPELENRRQA